MLQSIITISLRHQQIHGNILRYINIFNLVPIIHLTSLLKSVICPYFFVHLMVGWLAYGV
jgi:hypothetical protein